MEGEIGTMVKMLPCDLEVTDLSSENTLLQNNMVKLCTIEPLASCIK